jgi:acyl carrier protein
MSVSDDVERFIVDELVAGQISEIEPDEDLLAAGIVDSFGLQQLLTFIEERYGVSVDPSELTPANFRTIRNVEAFVEAQTGGRAC